MYEWKVILDNCAKGSNMERVLRCLNENPKFGNLTFNGLYAEKIPLSSVYIYYVRFNATQTLHYDRSLHRKKKGVETDLAIVSVAFESDELSEEPTDEEIRAVIFEKLDEVKRQL